MKKAKLFSNGGSQALRFPKEYSFPNSKEVYIHRCGNKIILDPINTSWEGLKQGVALLPDDFEFEREAANFEDRDLFND
ncbi:MAG: antitoxin [Gammaproteobacteria bacterium]